MTAVELVTDIVARGGRIVANADRPRLLVPGKLRLLAEANRNALRPVVRLWALLDAWAGMDEPSWTQGAVNKLRDDILDVFGQHPVEADDLYRAWRAQRPGSMRP